MDTGHFTRLSGDECSHLVRGHSVGRVCWVSTNGLQALPVSYVAAADGRIYFRTNPRSVMGDLAGPIQVAFEVDDIDVTTATGWSVLVQGVAQAYEGSTDDLRLEPWAPGDRTLTVAITPSACSGRAVSAAPKGS